MFRVPGFAFRLPGLVFLRFHGTGLRVSGCGFRVLGFGFRVSGSGGARVMVRGHALLRAHLHPSFGYQSSDSGIKFDTLVRPRVSIVREGTAREA